MIDRKVYYTLTGESYYDKVRQVTFYEIQCECGNKAFKTKSTLNVVVTCGMTCPISLKIRSEKAKNRVVPLGPKGLSGMSRIYDLYKRRAKKKNIDFSLTKDEFKELSSSCCYYCGEPPSMLYRHKQTKTSERERENSEYLYNSLDRIDSSLGYTLDNVRPSCKCCNTMKWNHGEDFFKERIKIFYDFYFKGDQGDSYEEHY